MESAIFPRLLRNCHCSSRKKLGWTLDGRANMTVDAAAIRVVLDESAETGAKSADPNRFFDNSLVQTVNRDYAAKLFPGEVK